MNDYRKFAIGQITSRKRKYFLGICALLLVGVIGVLIFCTNIFRNNKSETANSTSNQNSGSAILESETLAAKKQIVCLDPGHGGSDTGATYGKISESDINLTVALKVKAILGDLGYQIYMTRSDDSFVAKRARAAYCNSVNADILVSIHHNSYETDHTVDYDTALYYKDSDQLLASSLLNSTSAELNIKDQGIAKFDNSLLWIAKMPAALSESFFITNKGEYSSLISNSSTRLSDEAKGIATGIVNYFVNPEQIKTLVSQDSLIIDRTDLGD
ncbi:MAG: N-acetylmuramoyl-L-alanine amidase [Candidatus Berkelbacteria bacterium]|nr:N-acetylmuramoyl-L-alanine amidase [Candidatus Berkelbacteria bacterium]